VYQEGYITYANESKEKLLHVAHETLALHGAVSEETAAEMAAGAAAAAEAKAALATTGIAGPGGGTKEKPVGLVYIGCFLNGRIRVEECHFQGNRMEVREAAVERAVEILWEELTDKEEEV
ncbi:MAG TPA: damage-inducible protein CinA, partial [Lachnospiraceae bacterium]|nr:damage-inducible protein CinA [Lachnospiraceae bacterium]